MKSKLKNKQVLILALNTLFALIGLTVLAVSVRSWLYIIGNVIYNVSAEDFNAKLSFLLTQLSLVTMLCGILAYRTIEKNVVAFVNNWKKFKRKNAKKE